MKKEWRKKKSDRNATKENHVRKWEYSCIIQYVVHTIPGIHLYYTIYWISFHIRISILIDFITFRHENAFIRHFEKKKIKRNRYWNRKRERFLSPIPANPNKYVVQYTLHKNNEIEVNSFYWQFDFGFWTIIMYLFKYARCVLFFCMFDTIKMHASLSIDHNLTNNTIQREETRNW